MLWCHKLNELNVASRGPEKFVQSSLWHYKFTTLFGIYLETKIKISWDHKELLSNFQVHLDRVILTYLTTGCNWILHRTLIADVDLNALDKKVNISRHHLSGG